MGSTYLIAIPTDPRWTPTRAQEAAARALFLDVLYPDSAWKEVEASEPGRVQLYTAGDCFERLVCPRCHAVVGDPFESESMAWFVAQLDRCSGDDGFWPLDAVTPCCGASISLNELDDVVDGMSTMGFASWSLDARRPDRDGLSDDEKRELEAALGHAVRLIWMRI